LAHLSARSGKPQRPVARVFGQRRRCHRVARRARDGTGGAVMSPPRYFLPPRRVHVTIPFEPADTRYVGGVGFFDDEPRMVAELWLNGVKPDSAVDQNAQDCAVLASHLLQRGMTLHELRAALRRRKDGHGGGPLGTLVDIIITEEI